MGRELTAVELFAGAGGMALGTHRAGFRHLALLEVSEHAVSTLRLNAESGSGVRPALPLEPVDVRSFDYAPLQDASVDLLVAGAPCQPFSLGGVHRGQEDERNLFPEVFRAQRELMPKAVLLENVRGLTRPSFRPYLEYILLQLALPGVSRGEDEQWKPHKERLQKALSGGNHGDAPAYDVWIAVLDCANFGVPQRRHRVFMTALRNDIGPHWAWPHRTHSKDLLLYAQHGDHTYWDAHGMDRPEELEPVQVALPVTTNGEARWMTVRDALADVPEPSPRKPHPHHPNHIGIPGARIYPGHTGSPVDEPSKALNGSYPIESDPSAM